MQLIHRPTDPRYLMSEINLIPQNLTSLLRGPQSIERTAHNARRRLLIIEDTEHGGADENGEYG